MSETDNDAFPPHNLQSAVSEDSSGLEKVIPHSYRTMFEQFASSSLAIEPDDEDEDEQDPVWDQFQAAAGTLSPALKYQRTSAKWRTSNITNRFKFCMKSPLYFFLTHGFSRSQSSTSGTNAISYFTDDDSSMSGGTPLLSSRLPSARSFPASRQNETLSVHLENKSTRQQDPDRPKTDNDPAPSFQKGKNNKTSTSVRNMESVKRHTFLPIRSNLCASTSSILVEPPRSLRHPKKMHQIEHDRFNKAFRKLATNAASLTDTEIGKLLQDAGLGDGILSARRNNESGTTLEQVTKVHLKIRLSSDFASLKKMGCSENTLSALRAIDPPQQEIEIVADKAATGDMTMFSAPPESKLKPTPPRRFQVERRQYSSAESAHNQKALVASAVLNESSMLRMQPARRAGSGGSPLPTHLDWSLEAETSPVKFCSMNSHVPRSQEASALLTLSDRKSAITDWADSLQGTNYSYRSVFRGPPRFPEAKRDIVTPPLPQTSNQSQNHDRRSCTAQHKQQREPNLMLESRISSALAKEAQAPTTTERMGLRSVQDRAAALEVDQIGSHYGAKDHERIRNKQDRLLEVMRSLVCAFFLSFGFFQIVASRTHWNVLNSVNNWQEMFQEREKQFKNPPFML
jgi:hypothetical protein